MLEIVQLFIQRKEFFMNLLYQHLQISFISIVLAILIGGLIGIFMSEYKKISKPFMSIINFVYTIPSISMLGFLIPLSGVGNTTAIIALVIYALLPMVKNTYTGRDKDRGGKGIPVGIKTNQKCEKSRRNNICPGDNSL